MMSRQSPIPGSGAHRLHTLPARRYVYVARSRRAGGWSLGVDLTPDGYCSLACIYCQANHHGQSAAARRVDVALLEQELHATLNSEAAGELRDLVLAGSGEPTAVPNLEPALSVVARARRSFGFSYPMRVFTNGRHLGVAAVRAALAQWIEADGEVWAKLDASSPSSVRTIAGRSFDVAAHLATLWSFASAHEIGIQTMLVRGPAGVEPVQALAEVVMALRAGLHQGARVREVHLLTLSRTPSDEYQAAMLAPVPATELARYGAALADQTGLRVRVFGADLG